jgi:hypothetical protein
MIPDELPAGGEGVDRFRHPRLHGPGERLDGL